MRADKICFLDENEAKCGCEKQMGYMAQVPCIDCSGTGKRKFFLCKSCKGKGYNSKNLRLDLIIPASTSDGDVLTYKTYPQEDASLIPEGYTVRASVISKDERQSDGMGGIFTDLFGSSFISQSDISQQITINKKQAQSKPYILNYRVHKFCDLCGGTGEAVKEESRPCGNCEGQGMIVHRQQTAFGVKTTTSRCESCNGKGRIVVNPCPHCKGEGFIEISDSVEIAVEDQINGKRTIFFEKGHFINSQNRGKLFVDVTVK